MRKLIIITTILLSAATLRAQGSKELINNHWTFSLGDASSMMGDFSHGTEYFTHFAKAATSGHSKSPTDPAFDDSSWQRVSLPHDWVVDLPYSSEASHSHGYKCIGWKYPGNSVGWYRKHLTVPAEDKGKQVWIEFEGIFRDSEVFCNGFYLGHERSENDSKTMNTHLHILEGYTNLYRVWKDEGLKDRLKNLIGIFTGRIMQDDGHLGLFFGDGWEPHSTMVSYGHDIEASWLLREAAEVLGDPLVMEEVNSASSKIAETSMEGWSPEGGMVYEYDPKSGHRDADRHWWVQAETVVGCVDQFGLTGDRIWLERAGMEWKFIRENLISPDGEWYWSVRADGTVNLTDDRAGFWKCPYHNGRMCLEMLARL